MAASVILRIKNGKLAGKAYEFHDLERCLIGRAKDCEIRLPNEPEYLTASRHHCLLDIDPPAIRVRDSGSRNGTLLNGMQIGRPKSWHLAPEVDSQPCFFYDLSEGDELTVGSAVFEVAVAVSEEMEPQRIQETNAEKELCACG